MRFTTKQMFQLSAYVACLMTAFASGRRLDLAWLFVLIAGAAIWVVHRVFRRESNSIAPRIFATGLAVAVLCFVATPETFNSEYHVFIDGYQQSRRIRNELSVALSEQSFADIEFKCLRGRKIGPLVYLEGQVGSEDDFESLKDCLRVRCPSVSNSEVHLKIMVTESKRRVSGWGAETLSSTPTKE